MQEDDSNAEAAEEGYLDRLFREVAGDTWDSSDDDDDEEYPSDGDGDGSWMTGEVLSRTVRDLKAAK